jgi:hypothetical protein
MNTGGCPAGVGTVYDYYFNHNYECNANDDYYEESSSLCRWAKCVDADFDGIAETLAYSRVCGVDGVCSYAVTANCDDYDGLFNYPECALATGGGEIGSTSCGPEDVAVIDGYYHDYTCEQVLSSARCVEVGTAPRCGNDKQAEEECDGYDLGGVTDCSEIPGATYTGGIPSCYPAGDPNECTFNVDNCFTCGDGNIETPNEVCECGSDGLCGTADDLLGGETCVTQGFESGTLYCSSDCREFDRSNCVAGCSSPPEVNLNYEELVFTAGTTTTTNIFVSVTNIDAPGCPEVTYDLTLNCPEGSSELVCGEFLRTPAPGDYPPVPVPDNSVTITPCENEGCLGITNSLTYFELEITPSTLIGTYEVSVTATIANPGESDTARLVVKVVAPGDGEVGGVCGNSVIEGSEQCDCGSDSCTPAELNGETCVSLGLPDGTLSCYPFGSPVECQFDITGCGICTAGWKCKDANTRGYQQADCSWINEEFCPLGCVAGACSAASVARVTGSVTEVSGAVVTDALVEVLGIGFSGLSDASGNYIIEGIPEGTYDMVARKGGYSPEFVYDVNMVGDVAVDFVLSRPAAGVSGICEADCSYTDDNVCHSDCQGRAGCWFYDATTQTVCDEQGVGFIKDYGSGKVVECCTGVPYEEVSIPAVVEVEAERVFKIVRIVQLPDGSFGKLVVYTFN